MARHIVGNIQGPPGLSAYDLARQDGFDGTPEEWLESLRGQDGKTGADGQDGKDGKDGFDGRDGKDGEPGKDGGDGKDGAAATIEIGMVESVGSDEKADVTNSGTPAAAVLNFKLQRGRDITAQGLFDFSVENGFTGTWEDWLRKYLKPEDLPWCSGHFQDRSAAAGADSILTPLTDAGIDMIYGNTFVAADSGLYILYTGGGRTAGNPIYTSSIVKNSAAPNIAKRVFALSNTGGNISPAYWFGWLDAGEYLMQYINLSSSSPAISSFNADGTTYGFAFGCVYRGDR